MRSYLQKQKWVKDSCFTKVCPPPPPAAWMAAHTVMKASLRCSVCSSSVGLSLFWGSLAYLNVSQQSLKLTCAWGERGSGITWSLWIIYFLSLASFPTEWSVSAPLRTFSCFTSLLTSCFKTSWWVWWFKVCRPLISALEVQRRADLWFEASLDCITCFQLARATYR